MECALLCAPPGPVTLSRHRPFSPITGHSCRPLRHGLHHPSRQLLQKQSKNLHTSLRTQRRRSAVSTNAAAVSSGRPLRFIQHKQEAFWFYRFLSIVYDHIGKNDI